MWKYVGCVMIGMAIMSAFYWHSGASKPVYSERGRKIDYVRTPTAQEINEAKLKEAEAYQQSFIDQHNKEMREGRNTLFDPFDGGPAVMPGRDPNEPSFDDKMTAQREAILERAQQRIKDRKQ